MGVEHETAEEKQKKLEDKERSRQIERVMGNAHTAEQQINKLLLLGAGESGKSTLFKQMITIYGKGYPESERKTFTSIIYNNIITSMKILCHQSDNNVKNKVAAIKEKDYIEEVDNAESIDKELANCIKALWQDAGIKETFSYRAKFQFPDSAPYFFDRIDEIAREDYIPSKQDVLRSRVRTTGIVENEFEIEGNLFKMFDVGGQRNERKKWIHCFENVTAVIFVVAISAYDMVLYEDEHTNRMEEALSLFDEICNSKWFKNTSMILFLNKMDIFEEKIKTKPLTDFFKDFQGDTKSVEDTSEFIKELFIKKNQNQAKKTYVSFTTAT